MSQADGTIVRSYRITRCRRLLEPFVDTDTIVLFPHAGEQEIADFGARPPVPSSSGDAEPLHALLGIVRDAGTGKIEEAKRARRALVAGFGCAAEPTCCFRMIWRQISAGRMEIAERSGRFRIAGERGPTQPGFAVGWICIHSDAVHQRLPQRA